MLQLLLELGADVEGANPDCQDSNGLAPLADTQRLGAQKAAERLPRAHPLIDPGQDAARATP